MGRIGCWGSRFGDMIKELKDLWEFCRYVFIPQRRPKDCNDL